MNWAKLFSSPPPGAAWSLTEDLAALAVRDRRRGVQGAVRALPGGLFQLGPAGLQGVDRPVLEPHLAALAGGLGADRRPAVVLPTGWFRSHLLDVEGLPRARGEMEEVVRWRLKKLLPVPPAEMRLAVLRLGGEGERERILTVMLLERAATELESAFQAAGAVPGVITPRLFALEEARPGWRLVVEAARGSLALLVSRDGQLRTLRSRMVPPGRSPVRLAKGELRRLAVFARENLGVEEGESMMVRVFSDDEGERRELEELAAAMAGFVVEDPREIPEVPGLAVGAATRRALLRLLGDGA